MSAWPCRRCAGSTPYNVDQKTMLHCANCLGVQYTHSRPCLQCRTIENGGQQFWNVYSIMRIFLCGALKASVFSTQQMFPCLLISVWNTASCIASGAMGSKDDVEGLKGHCQLPAVGAGVSKVFPAYPCSGVHVLSLLWEPAHTPAFRQH